MDHVGGHHPADVTRRHQARLVAQLPGHQRVQVHGVRGDVEHVIRRQVAVACTPEVDGDDLEAGRSQRFDVAPPDALGLGIAVDQQQRGAAHALVHICQVHTVGDR